MRTAISILLFSIPIAGFYLVSCAPDKTPTLPETAGSQVYQRICQQCHGVAGKGNAALKTPSIAGQPAWYLEIQIEKFRRGWRGADPRDAPGQQMRAIAVALKEHEIEEVIQAVVSFPSHATEPTFEADLVSGKLVFEEQCMECHRYNASGEKAFGSSPLTAFQDWYIADQLEKFHKGIRGYHEDDEKGAQMRHLVSYLSEQELRDVSAYIASLAKRYPPK